jgi:toxin CptA
LSDGVRVHLRPSRSLAAAVIVSHAAALGAVVFTLPTVAAMVAGAGVALSALEHLRQALHRTPLSVVGLEFGADAKVAVAGPAGEWSVATLKSVAVPAPWLAVATMRDSAGQRRAVVVLPDAIDPEAFRRLRVWLRWGTVAGRGGTGLVNDPTAR